jgi:hypothetical protein
MLERKIIRYSAYFRGWCQAFGDHQTIHGENSGIDWLLADVQIGLVLPKHLIKEVYREVLLHTQPPMLTFIRECVQIGSLKIVVENEREHRALAAVREFMQADMDFHLYLASHLLYGGGNRIITFSRKKPLSIIYKEIGSMQVQIE